MDEVIINEARVPSFGEQLVGLDFNPSGNPEVQRLKEIFAEAAEIIKKNYDAEKFPLKSLVFDHASMEILSAQMAAVKLVTLKPWDSTEKNQ